MSIRPQASFSTGELDPALQERTTLAKFQSGLNVGRNVIISRGGSIISRISRKQVVKTKTDGYKIKGFSPPLSGYLIEWGNLYVRIYDADSVLVADLAHTWTEDDLENVHFTSSGDYVYVFCAGKVLRKLNYVTGAFVADADIFAVPPAPDMLAIPLLPPPSGTGYPVDYLVTYLKNGEESLGGYYPSLGVLLLPILNGEVNSFASRVQVGLANNGITETRWYRRPANAGAFGFVASNTQFTDVLGDLYGNWQDFGGAADYGHQPPYEITAPLLTDPTELLSSTGIVYEQRLIVTSNTDKEAIIAGRPGFQNNFRREFPLSSDSALKFKSGTSGKANVLRMIDSDGLVVFTTAGVYLNTGPLSPSNLSLAKKGKWIIDVRIPPLAVPGGVFFVDSSTNTVRNLTWSMELNSYNASDKSIFSNHLFLRNRITSWAFHEGVVPVLWVTFEDGTFASFTYEFDQQMQAWTRHDSELFVEEVIQTGLSEKTFFVVKDGNKRYIEVTVPRYVSSSDLSENPQAEKGESIALMDSMSSYDGRMNGNLVGTDEFEINPVTTNEWDGPLTLTCGTSGLFTNVPGGAGKVGSILRAFNNDDFTSVDLEVIARTSDNEITVQPSIEFPHDPSTQIAEEFSLYLTVTGMQNLSHLVDANVVIVVDGFVVASPKNYLTDYPVVVVDPTGSFVLPNDKRAAILHVGRPVVADAETLDVDTVEQKPTVIEPTNVDKIYVKTHRSTGICVGNKLPSDGTNLGMQELDVYKVDYSEENPIIGNRYPQPATRRNEVTLPGDWNSQGKIAVRQVDPLHFEVLSIILDAEIYWRSDR